MDKQFKLNGAIAMRFYVRNIGKRQYLMDVNSSYTRERLENEDLQETCDKLNNINNSHSGKIHYGKKEEVVNRTQDECNRIRNEILILNKRLTWLEDKKFCYHCMNTKD